MKKQKYGKQRILLDVNFLSAGVYIIFPSTRTSINSSPRRCRVFCGRVGTRCRFFGWWICRISETTAAWVLWTDFINRDGFYWGRIGEVGTGPGFMICRAGWSHIYRVFLGFGRKRGRLGRSWKKTRCCRNLLSILLGVTYYFFPTTTKHYLWKLWWWWQQFLSYSHHFTDYFCFLSIRPSNLQ